MELVLKSLSDNDKKLLRHIAVLNNQNFSKNLLRLFFDNPDNVGEGLYNLNRFGLIRNTENTDNINLFEMHDAVKNSVLQCSTELQITEVLNNIINKFNLLMRGGVTSRYVFITSDATLISNLEVLLENAEKYKFNAYKILELKKNINSYYKSTLNYYNWGKTKLWLDEQEVSGNIKLNEMTDEQKVNYSWYLVDIGVYEDFVKSSFTSALSYFIV